MHTILAIESSCDETAAAVMRHGILLSNVVSSQGIHSAYGGVVPELAAREHQKHMVPVVDASLQQAGVALADLDAIAVTEGPGLSGALLVGTSFARGLAVALGKRLIGVDHVQAHLLANFIEPPRPIFPFLGLVVSGGHTQLFYVHAPAAMECIGRTRDDAAGEAFDKTAYMMGIPYPGGRGIDLYARQGNPDAFSFPITELPGLDFSFSGIKTSVLYFLKKQCAADPGFILHHRDDLCASIQKALVEMLLRKVVAAAAQTGLRRIVLGGGVANNTALRAALKSQAAVHGWEVYIPQPAYCTDNAAMIAMTAHLLVNDK